MKKIAVFLGGKSTEKKVSKFSGAAVINALRTNPEYKVFRCDPANPEDMENFLALVSTGEIDLVYNALHGSGAEDGEMQGFLNTLGVPSTGPGVHGAAIAFDKISTKRILRSENIPLSSELTFEKINISGNKKWRIANNSTDIIAEEFSDTLTQKILTSWAEKISFPAFAKAAREGSSYGVYPIKNAEEFIKILTQMTAEYSRILVEPRLSGIEVTCAVVDGKAMELVEIVAEKGEFYDYESKYEQGGSSHFMPPREVSSTAKAEYQKTSEKIGYILDLDCPYRVDAFIDGGEFWILEINTLPGMTDTSLLPEAYMYTTKKSFADMCIENIEKALRETKI